ncbi:helix-turn-helix domain-containing protein [Dysgonomonas sp. GY617]|uniref:helix-turn-helix domain-containing protein n=1 Tax=Dysgonomonas sp. GY617 TaxID=2780420 RepID=UPI0018847698|nr:helix-turn-helix transcriptional regulator [Dysgonomonas sp. GY617]MBF0577585.1 helix-turn-helix transcriptional regulator [Dysgonomonas sp. GY617]
MNKQEYTKKRRLLSKKLVEAREKAGLTQKQVADTKIIAQSELSKLENGSRKIEFLFLLELAELYNQPITFFVPETRSNVS